MAFWYVTTDAKPAGLFPMQNLTGDDCMTLAAVPMRLHCCAGRSVVEITDRVWGFHGRDRQGGEGQARFALYPRDPIVGIGCA
jgi:hypothetical protein